MITLRCPTGTGFYELEVEKNIKSLDLTGKRITALPDNLKELTSLTILQCRHNKIEEISYLPPSLVVLNCSYNKITSLPSALPSGLEILKCDTNPITTLPPLPTTLKTLEIFDTLIKLTVSDILMCPELEICFMDESDSSLAISQLISTRNEEREKREVMPEHDDYLRSLVEQQLITEEVKTLLSEYIWSAVRTF